MAALMLTPQMTLMTEDVFTPQMAADTFTPQMTLIFAVVSGLPRGSRIAERARCQPVAQIPHGTR
jgi:hypothetical protein